MTDDGDVDADDPANEEEEEDGDTPAVGIWRWVGAK
jgi:hypothetical protein